MFICHASGASLVARYSFDNIADLGHDDSGNGYNLSVYGIAPDYSASGKDGGAAAFNGTTQGFQTPAGILPAGSFTLALWFKADAWENTAYVTKSFSSTSGFQFYGAWNTELAFATLASTGGTYVRPNVVAAPGEWTHVAFTFEAASGPDGSGDYIGTVKGYINGVLKVTAANAKYNAAIATKICLGRYGTGYFDGMIDDYRIYNDALRDTEIVALASRLVAYYSFNDESNLGRDDSGNGHNLSIAAGAPGYSGTSSAIKWGGAAVFNGGQSFITPTNILPNGSFSIALWTKFDVVAASLPLVKPFYNSSGFQVSTAWSPVEYAFGILSVTGGSDYTRPIYQVPQSQWQHLALTFEALSGLGSNEYHGTVSAYIDGNLKITKTNVIYKADSTNTLCIGGRAGVYFSGMLDELRIYNSVLPSSTVKTFASSLDEKRAGLMFSLLGVYPALNLAGPESAAVTPFRGLLYTGGDIKAVRTELQSGASRRRGLADRQLAAAQWWVDRGRAGVDALLPPDGSVYAFGTAGDPKTEQSWPIYGRSDDVCSLDRPGQVKSPYTGDIYGIQTSGELYYDSGDGWVDPETGTRYYFKGVWNCFAIWKMHEAVDNLSIAYMLTGDERCAELGLYMLDQFAGMRRRNPLNYGLIDYPGGQTPNYGFFGFMGNIANDRMIFSALSFDLMAGSEYAKSPSQGTDGLTVAQNIQQHYFEVFEPWWVENISSLQNHAIAAFGAMLSQALLFGDAEHTRLGIDVGYAFFDSCVNRDGDYYEMSGSYSRLGRRYGGLILNLLSRYRMDRYDLSAGMPDPNDYPYALQFGNNPLWYSTAVEMLYRHTVLGRYLQYGDARADRAVLPGKEESALTQERATYLSLLYQQTTQPQWKQALSQRYWSLPDLDSITIGVDDLVRFGPAVWIEPYRPDVVSGTNDDYAASDIMPAKGLAILRSGDGENRRAFYMRAGMGNTHAHDDQMALTLYSRGITTTGEYGYFYYGTPDFCGWGTRSIAHNMVVVNEDLPQPAYIQIAPWKRAPPADIEAVALREPAQLVEMRNPRMWENVTDDMQDYRRTTWLIDLPDDASYFVDIFQVVGGRTHDYAWHSPYLEPRQSDDGFSVSGVTLAPKNGVWVLAAQDNNQFSNATYNVPGQAWGERLLGESGRIKDLGIPGEYIGYSAWSPPPGNGYGFIYNLRSAQTVSNWTAQWLLHDKKTSQRLHVLNYDGMTAISGQEPVLDDTCRQTVAIARRTQLANVTDPLHSRFVTVNEVAATNQFPLRRVQRVETTGAIPEQDRIALAVEGENGTIDTILVNRQGGQSQTPDGIVLNGSHAFVRQDASGAVSDMLLQEGTRLVSGGVTLEASASAWEAVVTNITFSETGFSLGLDHLLPEGERLRGAMALFSCPTDNAQAYSHKSWFKVEHVENSDSSSKLMFADQQLAMAYFEVESVNIASNTITTRFPSALVSLPEINYLNGHYALVVSDQESVRGSQVVSFRDNKTFVVQNAAMFSAGDRVAILAVQAGDLLRIPSQVTLNRVASGRYELHTTHDTVVTLPGSAPIDVRLELFPDSIPLLGP